MKRSHRRAALAAAPTNAVHYGRVSLGVGVQVDRTAAVIRNVSVMTAGEALGWGFVIDGVTLNQVVSAINAAEKGVDVHWTHDNVYGGDAIGALIGRLRSARVEGDQVRADLHVFSFAAHGPHGDLREYLFSIAEEAPESFGLSAVFTNSTEERGEGLLPAARIKELFSVDLVGEPAANPAGLLSARPSGHSQGGFDMNPKLKKFLVSLGLPEDATDEQAKVYLAKLKGDAKKAVVAFQEMLPGEGDVTPDLTPEAEEEEQGFVDRFVADPGMQAKYPDGAARIAKAKEIYAAANAPAETPPAETPPAEGAAAAQGAPAMSARQRKAILEADRKRRADIVALAKKHNFSTEWAQGLCDRDVSLAEAERLVSLAEVMRPIPIAHVGEDRNLATLGSAITDAICLRARVTIEKPHERAKDFRHLSMVEIGRSYLQALGIPGAAAMSRMEIAAFCFNRMKRMQAAGVAALAMSTSDFDYILANTARKSLAQQYALAEATWSRWARRATVVDFKTVDRDQLSNAPALAAIKEGGPYIFAGMTEKREQYTLVKYGKGVKFTREAFINDDLSAFERVLPAMGAQAKYLEDTIVYAILTANAALSDSVALFHNTHANTTTGTLSVASLGAARAKMRKQTHLDGATLIDAIPRALIVPVDLETAAEQLIGSIVDPAKSNATPNPFANQLEVVATPHLSGSSTAIWYLAANPSLVDTVEVAFLESEPEPVVEEEEDFDTDCRKYKVRHHCVAKALDYRGLLRSTGA